MTDEVGLVRGPRGQAWAARCSMSKSPLLTGSGKLELTGNLGNVMKESCQAAMTCIRSRAGKLGIEADFYKTKDIHPPPRGRNT